jgi:hypothetical protein
VYTRNEFRPRGVLLWVLSLVFLFFFLHVRVELRAGMPTRPHRRLDLVLAQAQEGGKELSGIDSGPT